MENMYIYERSKACPNNALRTIQAGKLKGKSDINPIWRIKMLTELFGPCGIGWKLCNVKYWTEPGAEGEVAAWCSMELKYKADGQWSEGIEGIGGSMLVNTERGKLVTNDEAFKMAYTDAVSVCCKQLGFAADVYWEADRTKYSAEPEPRPDPEPTYICEDCTLPIKPVKRKDKTFVSPKDFASNTKAMFGRCLCLECYRKAEAAKASEAADAT